VTARARLCAEQGSEQSESGTAHLDMSSWLSCFCRQRTTRAWPCGVSLHSVAISQLHARRIGYLKSMSSAILTCLLFCFVF
jgi:hypothetical protein